jgi:hypothetical protein
MSLLRFFSQMASYDSASSWYQAIAHHVIDRILNAGLLSQTASNGIL